MGKEYEENDDYFDDEYVDYEEDWWFFSFS